MIALYIFCQVHRVHDWVGKGYLFGDNARDMTDLSSIRLIKNLILKQSSHDGVAKLELELSQKKLCPRLSVFKTKNSAATFFSSFYWHFSDSIVFLKWKFLVEMLPPMLSPYTYCDI